MLSSFTFLFAFCASPIFCFPSFPPALAASPTVVSLPTPISYTGVKKIPDDVHPWIAPKRGDERGPCPGLNTLANHGYLPRNGIATLSQIVEAVQEGFNMDFYFAQAVASYGMLVRGNPAIDQLSIGGVSSLIPPLVPQIDGVPGGLSKHGRFEGDVSLTRADLGVSGNDSNFRLDMYADLLTYVAKYGSESNVNESVFSAYKYDRFLDSYKGNANLTYHLGRQSFGLGESALVLNLFPNSVHGNLTVDVMSSFFINERFPPSWHRRSAPFTFVEIANVAGDIQTPHFVPPGAKVANGTYVDDPSQDLTFPCNIYYDLIGTNVPAILLKTTGITGKNVATFQQGIYDLFSQFGCPFVVPFGPANV